MLRPTDLREAAPREYPELREIPPVPWWWRDWPWAFLAVFATDLGVVLLLVWLG